MTLAGLKGVTLKSSFESKLLKKKNVKRKAVYVEMKPNSRKGG